VEYVSVGNMLVPVVLSYPVNKCNAAELFVRYEYHGTGKLSGK